MTAYAHVSCPMQVWVVPKSLPSLKRPSRRSSTPRINAIRSYACSSAARASVTDESTSASGWPSRSGMAAENVLDTGERRQLGNLVGIEHAVEALLERDDELDVAYGIPPLDRRGAG